MPLETAAVGTPGFSKNIATERAAGKPEKQAVAIAYGKARGDAGRQIISGTDGNIKKGDKQTQEWNGRSWKTVDPKTPAKGPRETQTWTGSRWDSERRKDASPQPLIPASKARIETQTRKRKDGTKYYVALAYKGNDMIDGCESSVSEGHAKQYLEKHLAGKAKRQMGAPGPRKDASPVDVMRNQLAQLKRQLGSGSPASQNKWRAQIAELEKRIKASGKPLSGSEQRWDAAPGCTFILVDGKTDQVVQHTGNYKAIIAREVRDLKKMDVGRVTTKEFENETAGYAKYGDSGREGKMIHALLRGRADASEKMTPAQARKWGKESHARGSSREWLIRVLKDEGHPANVVKAALDGFDGTTRGDAQPASVADAIAAADELFAKADSAVRER